jgi:hypothetical protein
VRPLEEVFRVEDFRFGKFGKVFLDMRVPIGEDAQQLDSNEVF